jgi:hypothetical protein
MVTSMMNRGLLAAIAASALALVALVLFAGSASANPGNITLSADPASIEPGAQSTVTMSVTPASGETVGGITVEITYDETLLTVDSCTPAALCNPALAPGKVGIALFDAAGLTGAEATVTFESTGTEGTATVGINVTDCQDATANPITCPGTGTSITIAAATATPSPAPATPTPAVTASPTKTPGGLPATGGPADDSSGTALTLVLAATGLLVISGAVWATARARRVS